MSSFSPIGKYTTEFSSKILNDRPNINTSMMSFQKRREAGSVDRYRNQSQRSSTIEKDINATLNITTSKF